MQKDELLKLAARVEALNGPDREIDGLIAIYIAPDTPYIVGDKPGPFPQEPIHGTFIDCFVIENGKDRADYIGVPHYTASLDAAMTLVPGGENGRWNTGKFNTNAKKCSAQVAVEDEIFIETGSLGRGLKVRSSAIAATPALALCAAALRALAGGE